MVGLLFVLIFLYVLSICVCRLGGLLVALYCDSYRAEEEVEEEEEDEEDVEEEEEEEDDEEELEKEDVFSLIFQ